MKTKQSLRKSWILVVSACVAVVFSVAITVVGAAPSTPGEEAAKSPGRPTTQEPATEGIMLSQGPSSLNSSTLQTEEALKSPGRLRAEELVREGIELSRGPITQATLEAERRCYEQACDADLTYAAAHLNLALVYVELGRYGLADGELWFYVRHYDKASGIPLTAYYMMGLCNEHLGRPGEALKQYSEYMSRAKDADSGLSKEDQGHLLAAEEALQRLQGDAMMVLVDNHTHANVSEMIEILRRPRIRSRYKYDGPCLLPLVQFDKDRDTLRPEGKDVLQRVAEALKDNEVSKFRVSVAGHASTEGDPDHNDDLSKRRAEAVVGYLARGDLLAGDRFETQHFGATRPIVDDRCPFCNNRGCSKCNKRKETNRRVEIENTRRPLKVEPSNVPRTSGY